VPHQLLPVVYARSSPVYGVEKTSLVDVVAEYQHMASLAETAQGTTDAATAGDALGKLMHYLATTKRQVEVKDELLDELF
jgi:hypothetical protein